MNVLKSLAQRGSSHLSRFYMLPQYYFRSAKLVDIEDIPQENNDGKIKRTGYVEGERPQFGYQNTYKYTEDYRPWAMNCNNQ